MTAILLKKVSLLLFFLWAAGSLVFFLVHALPGDPVLSVLGPKPRTEDVKRLRQSLKLDQPLSTQYLRFIKKLAACDLGESLLDRKPVLDSILKYFPNTAYLTGAAIMITLLIAWPLGVLAALKKNSGWEALTVVFSACGLSVPSFLLGILLIILFAVELKLFPVSGGGGLKFLILPALTLGISLSAFLMRMIRSAIAAELQQPYVLLARAKGLSVFRIFYHHIFKNALIPIITLIALQLGALLSGTIIIENVFSWPGIGTLLITAIRQRDFPLVQGTVVFLTAVYLLLNFLVDLSYPFFNPRIRHDRSK